MGWMSLRLVDNTADLLKATDAQIEKALVEIGINAEAYAKQELSRPKPHKTAPSPRPTVDTGRLRASIVYATAKNTGKADRQAEPSDSRPKGNAREGTVYIGTNVEYAQHVELGTYRQKATPYLRPAIADHIEEYKKIMKDCIKGN